MKGNQVAHTHTLWKTAMPSQHQRPLPLLVRDSSAAHDLNPPVDSPVGPSPRSIGNPLSSKINAVLATSFTDAEFRDVLSTVDRCDLVNTPVTRRQLRLQLQREVIESNGEIIREFGRVAEVSV